ncbi:MAG: hypothetical protein ACLUB8_04205 [Limosilactobacillus vaginalis]|uniref:hypothetical protein n=1 Tax=Limosilactobacillus vaginalis TaxID=1633 RepID=UPI000C806438|nr:hypothetical protein CJ225_05965 [Gardnerella vaginalis]
MTENPNGNRLVNNIGGYVIKIGDAFVASYQRCGFIAMCKNYPYQLVPNLSDVQEVLYNINKAKEMAKKVNGRVYQICVKPVEDN